MKKMNKKDELKKIRQQRKKFEEEGKIGIKKSQKRKVEIIEYDDGTFSLIGFAYSLPLQKDEVEFAFKSWLNNSLEEGFKLS